MADETTQQSSDNEFAAAFAELAQIPKFTDEVIVEPPAGAPATPPAAAPATPPVATAPVVTEPPAAAGAATEPPAETPPAAAAPAAEPPAAPDLAAEVARLSAELAAAKAAPAAAPAAAAPTEEPPAAAPIYTEAELALIDKHKKDWTDVAQGEALVRREEYQQLVAYVFSEVRKELAPLAAFVATSSTETQYSKIVKLVPDYDVVRDPTLAWIDTQPAYLKAAYKEVTENGSPSDVADLIARFKKETAYVEPAAAAVPAGTPPAAAPAAAPAASGAVAAPAKAVKNAAQSLKVVQSSRSEPAPAGDPNDFDSAFKEFAGATAK